jgi:4-hydroxybutyrate CoA-transferase
MDWQARWGEKIISAEKAAGLVKSGDLVRFGVGRAPIPVLRALAGRKDELRGVTIIHGFPVTPFPAWNEQGWQDSFHMVTDYVGGGNREGIRKRVSDFLPIDYPQYSKQRSDGRSNTWEPDIFIAAVSLPDEKGYCSFGNTLWYSKDLAQNAKVFIGEVDPNLIRTYGDNFIHASEIDYLVEESEPVVVGTDAPAEEDREVLNAIGRHAASLIRDGDTIQMGIGAISESTGLFLGERNDLGIHSELLTTTHVDLVKKGIATGRYKSLHRGKAVAAFIVGAADLDFVDNNPAFELYSVLYVNRIPVIAAQHHMVAVNSCIAIDLTGQVAAESIGPTMYSGVGGQMDFMIGALHSEGGRSIMLIQSTARRGTVSRIVPHLEPGSIVSTPRTYLDHVVSEFGIASMQGKTQRQRAEALIEISHPDFRNELRKQAKKLFWP